MTFGGYFTAIHRQSVSDSFTISISCCLEEIDFIYSLFCNVFCICVFPVFCLNRLVLIINRNHRVFFYFRVVYSLILNEKGGVEADVTVSILDGGSGQQHEPIFKVPTTE